MPSLPDETRALPFGNGRSYGDVCLNDGGVLLDCRGLDRFINFDREKGIIRCEGGVLLLDILRLVVPDGWFLPVVPGTQWVTIGGAIANDIHGKNHHVAGTIGHHIRSFELLRSDSTRRICSPSSNADWFRATVGGLGLTGIITWAEIQLKPISGSDIVCETIRFHSLDQFFEIARESDTAFEYTVAWIDALATGRKLGRGVFFRGNHATTGSKRVLPEPEKIDLGCVPPIRMVTRPLVRLFNTLYAMKNGVSAGRVNTHYVPFFFPLDVVGSWNRLYGTQGMLQYQFVVPSESALNVVGEILDRAARSVAPPFLTVLKVFGDRSSPGLLSFPRPGITMAIDFPNRGQPLMELLESFDALVTSAGGALYPAKDARMSPETFRAGFPSWEDMLRCVDPSISSSFWRRVTGSST
jgi:FAD/FMN-containing dehydrogenase